MMILPDQLKNFVKIDGEGPVSVVLGHGFGSDKEVWDSLLACLPKNLGYLRYDLAGAGSEEDTALRYRPDYHNTLFAYADDLIELLQVLKLDRVRYIGHSVSCMIGAIAAVARPELFSELIFIGASPHYLQEKNYPGTLQQKDLNSLFAAMSTNYQAWAAGFAPQIFGIDDQELLAEYSKTLFRLHPEIALRTLRMIFQSDLREIVGKVTQPVHLIHSRPDFAVPEPVAVWLQQQIPGSTLDWIDSPGHLPHVTQVAAVCARIHGYLRGNSSA